MSLQKHLPAYRRLDQLVLEGRAQLVGTPTDAFGTLPPLVVPDVGQVAIITKLISMGYIARETSPMTVGGASVQGVLLSDQYANTRGSGTWLSFFRHDPLHGDADTPSWRNAQPCVPIVWEPEDPIVVPPTWTLRSALTGASVNNDMCGTNWIAYGYITDVGTARQLGFHVNDYETADSPSDLNIRSGIIGAEFTSSAVEILAGRAGQCIQIVDMFVRQQQFSHTASITGTIRQTDDRNIFKFCNNNPSDFAEWKFSPGFYLKSGQGIEILGDSGVRATVTIAYRFVDADQVPSNHWWAYREPQLPTPASGTLGTLSLFTTASSTLTLYYPKLDTTATAPGTAYQHIVEGYAISLQKDFTAAPDQLFFAITTGDAAGTIGVAASGSGMSQTNKLISPIIAANAHDQCIFLAVDGLNIPCGKDTGLVLVDTTGNGETFTPLAADLDVDEWHILVWGRTEGARYGTTHFRGAAS